MKIFVILYFIWAGLAGGAYYAPPSSARNSGPPSRARVKILQPRSPGARHDINEPDLHNTARQDGSRPDSAVTSKYSASEGSDIPDSDMMS